MKIPDDGEPPEVTTDIYGGYAPRSIVEEGVGDAVTRRGTRASRLRWRGRCSQCSRRIGRSPRVCPHCGFENEPTRRDGTLLLLAVLGVLAVAAAWLGYLWLTRGA